MFYLFMDDNVNIEILISEQRQDQWYALSQFINEVGLFYQWINKIFIPKWDKKCVIVF